GVAGSASRPPATGHRPPNPPRPFHDLNQLPAHNYNLVPVERYFTLKGKRQLDYISSQGCRFRCSFCADPYVYNRAWSGLSPQRVGAEIESLWQRYRFAELSFQDETFFTRRERVEAIAEELIARRLEIGWTGTLRADQGFRLPDEVLAKCRRAGLRRVMVGVESGSQAMLDWIKKDIKLEQVWDTAEKCARHRIGMIINIIVGFPGEPDESVAESLAVAKRLRAISADFEVAVFYYKPYPGNAIADRLLHEGYTFPQTLEAWANFDYVGSSGPWVTPETWHLIEGFKFYQRFAFGRNGHPLRQPLRLAARWRVDRDFYAFPVEKWVVERLRPRQRLS
ncbi:MAG TPA: B12-binding domain-containing radical SAM protein, partial [Chloroflexi bacterium]|nr:B12-binding domain-containing radical SAM protein [Chloroflexota bacterium]